MPPLDDVLAAAADAEADVRRRKQEAEARAIRQCEGAIAAAHEALKSDDGSPDLDTLGRVLIAFAAIRPRLDDFTHRRMRRAGAHVLASASKALDRYYSGPRSEAAMPAVMPRGRLPPLPTAADDDDL